MAQKANANVFSDGLSQDFFHTNEKNTTLSDALNATLISRNGNELSLQNDMGNTKLIYREKRKNTKGEIEYIDNEVKLPQNFVPVGMKEYGGIVYILSTSIPEKANEEKQFQIGSFPGPQFSIPEETQLPDTEIATIVPDIEISDVELNDDQLKRTAIDDSLSKAYNLLPHVKSDNSTKYVFRACDAFKMTLFGLDFETITEPGLEDNKRKLYTYKIINTYASGLDITDAMQKQGFHLGINQYHSTWKLDDNMTISVYKNNEGWLDVLKDSEVQDLTNNILANTLGIYSCIHYGYGKNDVELTKYFSLYSSSPVDKIIVYTGNNQQSFDGKKLELKHKKDLKDKEFVYYPNIKKGNLSIQFQLEKVDTFQLCRINQKYIDYTFDLQCTNGKKVSDSVKKQIETFLEKLFLCELKLSDSKAQVNYYDDEKFTSLTLEAEYDKEKEKLSIPFYGKYEDKDYEFCKVIVNLNEKKIDSYQLTNPDNDYSLSSKLGLFKHGQYYLSLPNLLIKQPSWVKINELEVSYKLVDNDDGKIIRSRTYRSKVENKTITETSFDEALVNDEKDNIYTSPIQDIAISKKDVYLFVRDENKKQLGCISIKEKVEEENTKYYIQKETDTSKGTTVAQPIYNDDKNVTLELKVRPINTDYNIDLDYLTFKRTIDFSKSKDQWLGSCEYKKSDLTVEELYKNFNVTENHYLNQFQQKYPFDEIKDYFIDNRVTDKNVSTEYIDGKQINTKGICTKDELISTSKVTSGDYNYRPYCRVGTFKFTMKEQKKGEELKDSTTYKNKETIKYVQSKTYLASKTAQFKGAQAYNIVTPHFWDYYSGSTAILNLVPTYTYTVPDDVLNKLKNIWFKDKKVESCYSNYITDLKAEIKYSGQLAFMYGLHDTLVPSSTNRWITLTKKNNSDTEDLINIKPVNSSAYRTAKLTGDVHPGDIFTLQWYMIHRRNQQEYWLSLVLDKRKVDSGTSIETNNSISPFVISYKYIPNSLTINWPSNIKNKQVYDLGNLYVIKQNENNYLPCNIKYDVLYNGVNEILEDVKYNLNDNDYSVPFTNHYENLIENYATTKKIPEQIKRLTTSTEEIAIRNSFPATHLGDSSLFHRYKGKKNQKITFTADSVSVKEYYIVAFYTSKQQNGIKISKSTNIKNLYIPNYAGDVEDNQFKYSDKVMIAQKVLNPSSFTYKLPDSLDECIFQRYVMLVIPSATNFDITLELTNETIIHNPIYYNIPCGDLTNKEELPTYNVGVQIGIYKYIDTLNKIQLLVSDFNVQGLQINSELTKKDTYKYFDDTYERNFVPLPFFDIEDTVQIN